MRKIWSTVHLLDLRGAAVLFARESLLMNLAESRRDEKILSMDDWELIQAVLGTSRDEALSVQEYEAFKEMSIFVAGGRTLSVRQRAWLEEAARKVIPVDSRLVPRGKEVATPTVLQKLPIKPPGRR